MRVPNSLGGTDGEGGTGGTGGEGEEATRRAAHGCAALLGLGVVLGLGTLGAVMWYDEGPMDWAILPTWYAWCLVYGWGELALWLLSLQILGVPLLLFMAFALPRRRQRVMCWVGLLILVGLGVVGLCYAGVAADVY